MIVRAKDDSCKAKSSCDPVTRKNDWSLFGWMQLSDHLLEKVPASEVSGQNDLVRAFEDNDRKARRVGIDGEQVGNDATNAILKRKSLNPIRNLAAYLRKVLARKRCDAIRKEHRGDAARVGTDDDLKVMPSKRVSDMPGRTVAFDDMCSYVANRATSTLPPKQNAAVQSKISEELSSSETAGSEVRGKANTYEGLQKLRGDEKIVDNVKNDWDLSAYVWWGLGGAAAALAAGFELWRRNSSTQTVLARKDTEEVNPDAKSDNRPNPID